MPCTHRPRFTKKALTRMHSIKGSKTDPRKPTWAVLGLFKNEGDIIREWCQHYIIQGANQIILVNNNSSDDWRSGLAELGHDQRITCLSDERQHAQESIYNDVFKSGIINSEWLLVCDLDEFVYARKGFESITDFLDSIPKSISSIIIPWKNFGSSGHTQHPDGRVTDNFTARAAACREIGKAISRTKTITSITIHEHLCRRGLRIRPSGALLDQSPVVDNDEQLLAADPLHLNHYSIRSLQYYQNVKMKRGNAYSPDHQFGPGYFGVRDRNEVADPELKTINASRFNPAERPRSWFDADLHPLPDGPRAPVFHLPAARPNAHAARRCVRSSWDAMPFKTKARLRLRVPVLQGLLKKALLGRASSFILAGRLPQKTGEVHRFMAALAQAASPATPRAPIILDGTRATPEAIALATAWLKLLKLEERTSWAASKHDRGALTIRPRRCAHALHPGQAMEANWRNAAQCLFENGTFRSQAKHTNQQKLYAFALPPSSSGRFQQEMRALLGRVAMMHNAPLLELDQLPLPEKLLALGSYRWIIGPYFDDLELVHALEQRKGPTTILILLSSGKRRSRALSKTLHCTGAAAHRLLQLPAKSPEAAIHDLMGWIASQNRTPNQ